MTVRSSLGFVFGVAFTAGVVGVFAGCCGRIVCAGVGRVCPGFDTGAASLASASFVFDASDTAEFAFELPFVFVSLTTGADAFGEGCATGVGVGVEVAAAG